MTRRPEGWEPDNGESASEPLAAQVEGLHVTREPSRTQDGGAIAELLLDVERFICRYVVFVTDAQPCAIALWVAHCHAIEAADVTAYLEVTSPVKRSGKTRLLEVLELLVPRPVRTANISDAALFRVVDEGRPVILLDEADAIFGPRSDREDLRALLNAGYRRGAEVVRCEANGKKQTVRRFDAFSAKAIAAIGTLPDTVSDRATPIRLHRRIAGERVERFRHREAKAAAEPIRRALAAWAEPAVDQLRGVRPDLPPELNDRAQDGWEPLLAIADLAGEGWAEIARAAAVDLHGSLTDYTEEDLGVLALRHVREVFSDKDDPETLWTIEILEALTARDDAPWSEWWAEKLAAGRSQGPAQRLRRLLIGFGVQPATVRIGEKTLKGYRLADIADPALRHVPPTSGQAVTSSQGVTPLARDVTAVTAVTAAPDPSTVEPGSTCVSNARPGRYRRRRTPRRSRI